MGERMMRPSAIRTPSARPRSSTSTCSTSCVRKWDRFSLQSSLQRWKQRSQGQTRNRDLVGEDVDAAGAGAARHGVGDGAHAALRIGPGSLAALDLAHDVVQQDVAAAGAPRSHHGADHGVRRQRRLRPAASNQEINIGQPSFPAWRRWIP